MIVQEAIDHLKKGKGIAIQFLQTTHQKASLQRAESFVKTRITGIDTHEIA